MFLTLAILCVLLMTSNAALWKQEKIEEIRKMKACLYTQHASLITRLFPVASVDREKREAIALDDLGRWVKSGTPFCPAFAKMVVRAEHLIERRLDEAAPQDQYRWRQTLEMFKQRAVETRAQCEHTPDEGPLSPGHACISRVYQRAAMALIASQYKEEEQGFRNR